MTRFQESRLFGGGPVTAFVTIRRRNLSLDWKRGAGRGTAGRPRGTMARHGCSDGLRRSVLLQRVPLGRHYRTRAQWATKDRTVNREIQRHRSQDHEAIDGEIPL